MTPTESPLTAIARSGAEYAAVEPDPGLVATFVRMALADRFGDAQAGRYRIQVIRPPMVGAPARVKIRHATGVDWFTASATTLR